MSVLHRVEVDVVKMAFKVLDFFDCVFPELWLPDSAPPILLASFADTTFAAAGSKPSLSELGFDPLPTAGVVRVSRRHAPYRVKMVGQQNDCATIKRMRCNAFTHHVSKNRARDL